MINVRLFSDKRLIAKAQNIKLSSFSTSFVRYFSIFNVYQRRETLDPLGIMWNKFLIRVYFLHPETKAIHMVEEIDCDLRNMDISDGKEWKIETIILTDDSQRLSYSQGVVDVWNSWSNGEELLWWQLPDNITISEYNGACFGYSGITEIVPEKSFFEIDCKHIQSEGYVAACFAEAFYGKRAYLGRDFHTFKDCLIILYEVRGNQFFNDKTIKLIYKNYQMTTEQFAIIEKLISILKKFKFNLELC